MEGFSDDTEDENDEYGEEAEGKIKNKSQNILKIEEKTDINFNKT